eukprot:GHVT01068885.1.p1 GENE.GHVT01068885.1~~GHVT01068885.1.p1  ORF type:complete len:252 (-),score=58.78 GHVT01068885.1:212-967(-)
MSAEAGEASAALPVSLPLRCQALLSCGATRFDPSSIPTLVESVKEQIANESYDGDANLAMFKLFGMYPKLLDLMACRRGLVKAIMQLPASDATECIYLIPEATQNHPLIKPIITLEKNLQNCYFKKVWKTLEDKHMKDVAEIKGLQQSLRRFMSEVIGLTYLVLPVSELCSLLNLKESTEEFSQLLTTHGWELDPSTSKLPLADQVIRLSSSADFLEGPTVEDATISEANAAIKRYANVEFLKTCFSTLAK